MALGMVKTHSAPTREHITPRARTALGFGDAYDLSVWAWACDHSPHCRLKKKLDKERQIQLEQQQRCAHSGPATTPTGTTIPASTVPDAIIGGGNAAGGAVCGPGPWLVYHALNYAASAPQLSCANRPDKELEYLRAMAKSFLRSGAAPNTAQTTTRGSSVRRTTTDFICVMYLRHTFLKTHFPAHRDLHYCTMGHSNPLEREANCQGLCKNIEYVYLHLKLFHAS